VTLVEDHEMQYYGVVGLRSALREAGLRSIGFPVRDTLPPEDMSATRTLCSEILGWLGEGKNVLIHCIGGWGRSGTIAACLLCHQGYDARTAIGLVRTARHPRCVESYEQEQFVASYARAQQHSFRFYHLTTRERAAVEITGGPSARKLRGDQVARSQLLAADELPKAVAAKSGQTPLSNLVVVSGEVPFEPSALALVRDFSLDRAFAFEGARWVPFPLSELRP
jgi:protein-tyrosine phosphatase